MSFLKSSCRPGLLTRFVVVAIVAAGASVEANWPAFRGERASGIAESSLATSWNAANGTCIRWPTPVAAGDLMLVAGGGGHRPIYAVRPSATGDITPNAAGSGGAIADRASPYLPTPLVHRGFVYVCGNAGVLSVHRVADGSMVYRARVAPDAGGFSASPIAAAGRVYLPSEDGDVFVVAAGERFELLSRNPMGAPLFATPAVAGTTLIVRTANEVFGISG